MVWKWFCFIIICSDVLGYIIEKAKTIHGFAMLIGFATGIIARVYVLYGVLTCWLLA